MDSYVELPVITPQLSRRGELTTIEATYVTEILTGGERGTVVSLLSLPAWVARSRIETFVVVKDLAVRPTLVLMLAGGVGESLGIRVLLDRASTASLQRAAVDERLWITGDHLLPGQGIDVVELPMGAGPGSVSSQLRSSLLVLRSTERVLH